MISAQAVFTADILTCHGGKSPCVINITKYFTLISELAISHCDGMAQLKTL